MRKYNAPEYENIIFNVQNGKMLGSCIIEYSDADKAREAAEKINNQEFFKGKNFLVCTNEEFSKLAHLNPKYEAPNLITRDQLQAWLLDHRYREQFLVRTQDKHFLQWFDHIQKETESVFATKIFESKISKTVWSRNGSYLVTLTEKGFSLYGGQSFEFIAFFEHPQVKQVEFSPDERYILSFNGTAIDAPNSENYIVWRVGTNEKIKVFKADQHETWGAYKWNYNGQFLASCGDHQLRIFDLTTLKRTPIKIQNVHNFEWAPHKNLIIVGANSPHREKGQSAEVWGKIYLLDIKKGETLKVEQLKWKTITWEFSSCRMHWDPSGQRVIVVFNKLKGKKTSTVIQIGDLSVPTIPVEEHEFQDVKCVNIDDNARRVAVVSIDPSQKDVQSGTIRFNVELFRVEDELKGKFLQKVGVLPERTLSHVLWSPNGTFFALVNTDKLSANIGYLEFAFIKNANTVESIKNLKFPYMINAAWDPSGRCLITQSEKGHFAIWTAYGESIYKDNFTDLSQLIWRPKPKVVLPAEIEKDINENLKKYSKMFEEEDYNILNKEKIEKEQKRKQKLDEFTAYLKKKRAQWEATKDERIRLLGFDEENLTDLVWEEIVESEEPLDTKK